MQFDTIIFDLDGTLVDTADDLAAALNHALERLGRPTVRPAQVRQLVGRGARALLERGLELDGGATEGEVDAGLADFLRFYTDNLAVHSRPFDGVVAALDQLAAEGYRLAICTNKPERMARALVEQLGLAERFEALLGGDSLPYRKPDPRHLTETLHLAGGQRGIFIGDSTVDAETAHNAGVPLVLVSFGYSTDPVDQLGAARVIEHFAELSAAVAAIQHGFNGRATKADL